MDSEFAQGGCERIRCRSQIMVPIPVMRMRCYLLLLKRCEWLVNFACKQVMFSGLKFV